MDPILRKGYRFKGLATVHRDGSIFEAGTRFYQRRSGIEPARVQAIVLVAVEQAARVTSPAYDDGTPEYDVEQRSLKMYGLDARPAPEPLGGPDVATRSAWPDRR